jgi:hypothetical protein
MILTPGRRRRTLLVLVTGQIYLRTGRVNRYDQCKGVTDECLLAGVDAYPFFVPTDPERQDLPQLMLGDLLESGTRENLPRCR